MRVAKTVLAVVFLSLVATSAPAVDPTVDEMLGTLAGVVKQQAELAKQRADLAKAIGDKLKELQAKFDEINGKKPEPPGPPPVVDPLAKKVADAFAADAGQPDAKRADAMKLAALYSVAVEQKLHEDKTLTTVKQLIERIRSAGETLANDRLLGVRKAIAEELSAILKSPDAALDDGKRKAAGELFVRIEAALEALAK